MKPTSERSSPVVVASRLSLNAVVLILNDPVRWFILQALADGEPRMITELAKAVGKTPASVSKHVAVLRRLGVVRITRRLYQLVEAYRPAPGQSEIDLGYCVVRFPDSVGR